MASTACPVRAFACIPTARGHKCRLRALERASVRLRLETAGDGGLPEQATPAARVWAGR